ncbi:hypothetical protein K2173_018290 [Erythroxylum novogranatense]|uniref:ENT domain-containing protein n=1 Tax=Erythroxylum novogranatense TaxID=1862640 RepID=A0AAV8UA69_9ROSI|nr:hypothetical protein K2173_018290 [Erythroxylum novogranatense]
MMKLRKGDVVEVLRREHDPCSSWFLGRIIEVDKNYYVVRYGISADRDQERFVEKVQKQDVRPQPPCRKRKKWIVGDVVEVFDSQCWRAGKITKVWNKENFCVRLFGPGSVQVMEFHESNLRIRQAWHENKWFVIGKKNDGFIKSFTRFKLKRTSNSVWKDALQATRIDSCLSKGGGLRNQKVDDFGFFPVVPVTNKLEEQSFVIKADKVKASYQRFYASSRAISSVGSNQCSVGSSSSNGLANPPSYNCCKSLDNVFGNSDAESSFPSLSINKRVTPFSEQNIEAHIHELEFHAYRSTIRALYASGPLTWEQESLLTNLRLSLHISDEEHLNQLRHLLSSQVL